MLQTLFLVASVAASDITNWDDVTSKPLVVEVYSSKCESCKEFAPVWHDFATHLAAYDDIAVGRINIDTKDGLKLAQTFKGMLKRIPRVAFFATPTESNDYQVLDGTTPTELLKALSRLHSAGAMALRDL